MSVDRQQGAMSTDPAMRHATNPLRCGYYGHVTNAGKPCGGSVIDGTKACRRHIGVTADQARAEVASRRLFSQVDMPAPISGIDAIDDALARIHQVVLFLADRYSDGANEAEREEYRRWLETQAKVGGGKLAGRVDEMRARLTEVEAVGVVQLISMTLGRLGLDASDVGVREAVAASLLELGQ